MSSLKISKEGRIPFPFTAFVNHKNLKTALILVAINPDIGGLLVRGEKGTGKSVLVRALADLLPSYDYVKGCDFRCNPDDPAYMCAECREKEKKDEIERAKGQMEVVTLPLGATEDMVTGTLDVEKALREGIKALQPGILAKANRDILYIDEINLLPDNLVDVILDAAAMGWNYVEREGVSVAHPAHFVLVGSMNPEEGSLRPQLLDRLAMSVSIHGLDDTEKRVEVIRKNMQYLENPIKFAKKYREQQETLKDRIINAKKILPKVEVPDNLISVAANMGKILDVDGHRPDIVTIEAAKTLAAFERRKKVKPSDVRTTSHFALPHRTRRGGFLKPASHKEIDKAFKKSV